MKIINIIKEKQLKNKNIKYYIINNLVKRNKK